MDAEDQRIMEELNRDVRRPLGGGGNIDEVLDIDLSEAGQIGTIWPEGKYPFEIVKVERKQSQGGYDEQKQIIKESIPYAELTLNCIGGDMIGEMLTDRLMLAGKGLSRFVIFTDALGMYDKEQKRFTGRLADFIGQRVWAAVVTEKQTYKGRPRERSIIDFAGYEPIHAYELPENCVLQLGEFDEEMSDETPPDAETAEPVEESLEPELAHIEPPPSPAPPPAPARPAVRRATPAAAGSPGGKPPWSG